MIPKLKHCLLGVFFCCQFNIVFCNPPKLIVSCDSPKSLQDRIIAALDRTPFDGYTAFRADPARINLVTAQEFKKSGKRGEPNDIELHRPIEFSVRSSVYRYRGAYCQWMCDRFWVFLEQCDPTHVMISAVPIYPKVALGNTFNIHTFTFTPNWTPIPGTPFDSLPVLNHIAILLAISKPSCDEQLTPIDLDRHGQPVFHKAN